MSSEYSKGLSSVTTMMYGGKSSSLLPPKSPFPSISPSYVDYVPNSVIGQKMIGNPREGNSQHQRTSSEIFVLEEQPSWLDELLDEPDTPVRKGGHRRASSDSFAYIDTSVMNLDFLAKDENNKSRNVVSPSWQLPDLSHSRDVHHVSYYLDLNSSWKNRTRVWDKYTNAPAHPRSLPSPIEKSGIQSSRSSPKPLVTEGVPSTAIEKRESGDTGSYEPRGFCERQQYSQAKPSESETDTKRSKQQFAQRSRVRKLQYIAELENNVQALESEGSDVSAELEFLNQRVLILNMENKALKQRLENIVQEQLIKHLEHEVLEREKARLRALYQQQQQPQPPQPQQSSGLRRTSSRELDQQFANLALKYKEVSPGRDPISGEVHMST